MLIDLATRDLTDEGYALADAIDIWLEDHKGWHTPSRVGRGVKASTADAYTVLSWLERRVMVAGSGNGTRRRYSSRKHV